MNSDTLSTNTFKHKNLEKGSNTQLDRRNKPQVTDARQIFDNLNQSSQQKQKLDSNLTSTSHTSSSSTKYTNAITDTYARIVASNNRCCPKRLRQLAKPKRQARSDLNDYAANFDLNYGHVTKTYMKDKSKNLKELKKK
ncbi:PREDICTED: uncharacterized protein LOC108748285 isoform X2 [Trachymyrmex septentrionalis]|uniref:uncharacterized protein LOC108748285 isoform X2 n=1 Tax=Trachymyrmex septentrionalis TaxID=34720 RepID=UPI00084EEFE0|nr:PREDICTED: uncharacterized protein LOC108748285 isoform X2 [Trachymyrmex septentrionalis]